MKTPQITENKANPDYSANFRDGRSVQSPGLDARFGRTLKGNAGDSQPERERPRVIAGSWLLTARRQV